VVPDRAGRSAVVSTTRPCGAPGFSVSIDVTSPSGARATTARLYPSGSREKPRRERRARPSSTHPARSDPRLPTQSRRDR
jgi:hypothetical protein